MTQPTDVAPSGEERLKQRRRKFWRYMTLAFVASAVIGFFSGFVVDAYEDGTVPLAVPLVLGVIALLALAWFTWDYFRRVDELDLMDNLWSHLIGIYGGMIVYAVWYFGHDLGLLIEPTALGVVIAFLGITLIAYGARKLGWR